MKDFGRILEGFSKKRIFLITRSGKGEIPKEIKSNLMYFLARGFAKEIFNDQNGFSVAPSKGFLLRKFMKIIYILNKIN